MIKKYIPITPAVNPTINPINIPVQIIFIKGQGLRCPHPRKATDYAEPFANAAVNVSYTTAFGV